MKERFVKPDIYFTEFVPNQAVASVCTVTTYNKPVTVQCVLTGSETVYDTNVNGCDYTASSLILYGGGKYSDDKDLIKFTKDGIDGSIDGTYNSGSGTISAGYYLFWKKSGDNRAHGGLVPDAVSESIKNHS